MRILTQFEVNVLLKLSAGIVLGVFGGAILGSTTGAIIRLLHTRRLDSSASAAFCSALPGAALAVIVSLFGILLEMILCHRNEKGGSWQVPEWAMMFHLGVVFAAGAIGAFVARRRSPFSFSVGKITAWIFSGAVLGALAEVGNSFSGYFVVESNVGPISHALGGALIGGSCVLIWCLVTRELQRDQSTNSA